MLVKIAITDYFLNAFDLKVLILTCGMVMNCKRVLCSFFIVLLAATVSVASSLKDVTGIYSGESVLITQPIFLKETIPFEREGTLEFLVEGMGTIFDGTAVLKNKREITASGEINYSLKLSDLELEYDVNTVKIGGVVWSLTMQAKPDGKIVTSNYTIHPLSRFNPKKFFQKDMQLEHKQAFFFKALGLVSGELMLKDNVNLFRHANLNLQIVGTTEYDSKKVIVARIVDMSNAANSNKSVTAFCYLDPVTYDIVYAELVLIEKNKISIQARLKTNSK